MPNKGFITKGGVLLGIALIDKIFVVMVNPNLTCHHHVEYTYFSKKKGGDSVWLPIKWPNTILQTDFFCGTETNYGIIWCVTGVVVSSRTATSRERHKSWAEGKGHPPYHWLGSYHALQIKIAIAKTLLWITFSKLGRCCTSLDVFQDSKPLSTRKPAPIEIYHSDLREREMHRPWLHHPGKASPALRTSGRAPLSARAATRVVQNVR